MNGKLLLDTNIILDYLKGDSDVVYFLSDHPSSILCISVITRMELLSFHGITNNEERNIRNIIDSVKILHLNEDIEKYAIDIRRAMRIKLPDSIIAATAIVADAILFTRDRILMNMNFPGLRTVKLNSAP
jgi:predicted nucleic acid-binding protein